MIKYYIRVESSPERWAVENVSTDHQLGCYLLQKMMQSRDCMYTKEGIVQFVDKVLSNDNNKGLYPDKEAGIKDIATFITTTFEVHKIDNDMPIGGRRRRHIRYIIEKTLTRSVIFNEQIRTVA